MKLNVNLSLVSLPSSLSNTGWNFPYFGPEQLKGYEPLQPVMNLLMVTVVNLLDVRYFSSLTELF